MNESKLSKWGIYSFAIIGLVLCIGATFLIKYSVALFFLAYCCGLLAIIQSSLMVIIKQLGVVIHENRLEKSRGEVSIH